MLAKLDVCSILFGVAVIQFLIATAHVAVCTQLSLDGLVYSSDPTAYFINQAQPAHAAQIGLYAYNVSYFSINEQLIY